MRRAGLVMAVCLACKPAHGGVEMAPGVFVEVEVKSYPVYGTTFKEAHESVLERAPVRGAIRVATYSDVFASWHFRYSWNESFCWVKDFSFDVRIVRHIPRWDHPATTSSEDIDNFMEFVGARIKLEERRTELAARVLAQRVSRMESLRSERSCDDLKVILQQGGETVITELNDRLGEFAEKNP